MDNNAFICPVCKGLLLLEDKSLVCSKGHSFDVSKYGYVNLRMSQQSSAKRHGDDAVMVRARRDFLDCGHYGFLLEKVCQTVKKYAADTVKIIDIGCGECYYTDGVYRHLRTGGIEPVVCGIDISKDALRYGAKRNAAFSLAVASAFDLPVCDQSQDVALCMFAPFDDGEISRILKDNGVFVRVCVGEKHLMGLKEKIYETAYLNPPENYDVAGFETVEIIQAENILQLNNNCDINNLFMMTPYYYKTSVADQLKVKTLETLETLLSFVICVYKKK